jgi:hypothetical protein
MTKNTNENIVRRRGEKTMETRIEIDINAHSPTNDEMCKIITGKNISDFAHELQINPKYDYLFDKTA